MIELSSGRIARVSAPPLAPIDRPIDLEHLSRMTLGERSLEREVLQLFDRQAGMLMVRMEQSSAANIAAAAHTLMGSARGIGAWSVARQEIPRTENGAVVLELPEASAALVTFERE